MHFMSFQKKTLAEQFLHLGKLVGCHSDLLFSGSFHENKDVSTKNRERLSTLKKVLQQNTIPYQNIFEAKWLDLSIWCMCHVFSMKGS